MKVSFKNILSAFCISHGIVFSFAQQLPAPVACYHFAGNLNEANGRTSLTPINGMGSFTAGSSICSTDSLYAWIAGQGLSLPAGIIFPKNHYTIELLFKFTSFPYQQWWQRIINFKNHTDDMGLYIYDDNTVTPPAYNIQMYMQNTGTSNVAQPNTWFRLFLTRDSLTDTVKAYVNNILEIGFLDTSDAGVFLSDLIIFKDDTIVRNEESDGVIDYLRIYNKPLNQSQVTQIISVSAPTVTTSKNDSLCLKDSIVLAASGGATNYLWNTGATTSSITVSPASTTSYSVVAWNNIFCTKSCTDTGWVTVTVINCDTILSPGKSGLRIPNVFTPNQDGTNDLFELRATNISSLSIIIYNRWGVKVYEQNCVLPESSALPASGCELFWDGHTSAGLTCPQGTYYYIVKGNGMDGKLYDEKGFVTLLR